MVFLFLYFEICEFVISERNFVNILLYLWKVLEMVFLLEKKKMFINEVIEYKSKLYILGALACLYYCVIISIAYKHLYLFFYLNPK